MVRKLLLLFAFVILKRISYVLRGKITKKNSKEERFRILEAAASIIRGDITSAIVDTEFYPSPAKMLDNVNADIPESLTFPYKTRHALHCTVKVVGNPMYHNAQFFSAVYLEKYWSYENFAKDSRLNN